MKYILIIIVLSFSYIVSAQTQVQTDTTKGFNTAKRAVIDMYQMAGHGYMYAQFDNGSIVDLKSILNFDMKGSSPTYSNNLFAALAYMDKKGFKLVTSYTVGEYTTRFIFERKE
ncbi:MAG TPA: hypothetical protein VK796_10700 [Cytophaga sp.]|jgi:hypothetical protein|nr:hypothetical protein [Cytophaga sp.]